MENQKSKKFKQGRGFLKKINTSKVEENFLPPPPWLKESKPQDKQVEKETKRKRNKDSLHDIVGGILTGLDRETQQSPKRKINDIVGGILTGLDGETHQSQKRNLNQIVCKVLDQPIKTKRPKIKNYKKRITLNYRKAWYI